MGAWGTGITTDAWVLHQGPPGHPEPAELVREPFAFPALTEEEVLAEPICGCWEANMTHALERRPVDICRQRGEEKVVIGNAGVVRILKTGSVVSTVKEGDICGIVAIGAWDRLGNTLQVLGYDAPHTVGLLAKRIKLHHRQVIRLPANTRHSYQQWAAATLRYATAWSNWKVAHGCFRLQVSESECPRPIVWAWGGGVALAEVSLAKLHGCRVAMIASRDERLALIRSLGIEPVDRRQFSDLDFDEERFRTDRDYKERYLRAEVSFLRLVKEKTDGEGVHIFIENIGRPVFRATLRSLGMQGVITTQGWKHGMDLVVRRATECVKRHIHVHTHGAKYSQGVECMNFAEETGWMPPVDGTVYSWEEIPRLARDYAEGRITSYFPLFEVNRL